MYNHNFLQEVIMPKYPGNPILVIALGCFVCALIGYLLGSINFSIIISKVFYKDDIRTHGSGNAGSTNMLRTHGTVPALLTFAGDIGKAAIAVVIGAQIYNLIGAYVAGFFCIVGHIVPVFFHFKGGKGVATVAMFIALTNIKAFFICFTLFFIVVIASKYVSLGSIIAVGVYPPVLFIVLKLSASESYEYFGIIFAVFIAVLVICKHRTNIIKLINHQESKIKFSKKGTDGKN
ncbi:MAG: glycerol-3-phosphate 1-O-acyltransferase PlsY [Clostridia bacterium]|nr:glycerol-3-phosphate 1-O-acyltransferase PlsY [Clostridia bacterium]